MDFSRIDTAIGLLTLLPICAMFVISALRSPLGALSLPSMAMITSLIYFYLMPVVVLARGDEGFFGMYISDLTWVHTAVLLYTLGAIAAFAWHWRVLVANPAFSYPWDKKLNVPVFMALWAIAVAGVLIQYAQGKLNVTGGADYQFTGDFGQMAFMTQSVNLLIPLTLVLLVRERFSPLALLVLAIVLFVFLQAGFRFRILIMLASVISAYTLQRGIKVGILGGFLGMSVGLPLLILLGTIRRYGQGIDLSGFQMERLNSTSSNFGGEFGCVYSFDYIAAHPLPPLSPFEPWIIGITRLVPSFLWPDKPSAQYVKYYISGATEAGAEQAGIAVPQHAEILVQMGWWGLVPLAFLYFSIAGWLVKRVAYTGREVRLAGCAIIPTYFGYYMQTRGYFFQIFADALFMLGPLFLLNIGMRRGSQRPPGVQR